MAFNVQKYKDAAFEVRTAFVDIPELKAFFDKGDKPGIKVKGLSHLQYAQVENKVESRETVDNILEKLTAQKGGEVADAILNKLGIGDDIPKNVAKMLFTVEAGCIDAGIDIEFVNKFAERLPIDFMRIFNKIMELTGQGQILKKKSTRSGPKKK